MTQFSVWELFDPSHVGWLHRKPMNELQVTRDDLTRIVTANPDAIEDPVYRHYLRLEITNQLPRPIGRPKQEPKVATLRVASALIDNWADEIRFERRGRGRGFVRVERAPREQAADEVARKLGMNITGAALRNKISALNRV